MIKTVHRAKYVLAEPDLLLQNGAVQISNDGMILSVGPWQRLFGRQKDETEVVDWGSAVIMPGLINAHTHLELTHLRGQLTRFSSFPDWISQLIRNRRSWTHNDFLASAREGTRLSLASGTTLVGDITSSGVTCSVAKGARLRKVIFEEVIGLSPSQADEALLKLNRLIAGTSPDFFVKYGISPHAPYSVSAELYVGVAKMARSQERLLETHVSETTAEVEFLKTGTGEFRDFLSRIGSLPADWTPPGLHPIAYLNSLGILGQNCILIHCNYLDRESIGLIINSGSSVVYCPRSHDFFGHAHHPIRQLLDSGVNVALGTDSLASNTTLSLLDEMRYLFKIRKDIRPEEIFRAATLNGAKALCFSGSLGRLKSGYCADMTVVEIEPTMETGQVLVHILEGAGDCIATIVQGEVAWRRPE